MFGADPECVRRTLKLKILIYKKAVGHQADMAAVTQQAVKNCK